MVCLWIDKHFRLVFKHWGIAVARRPEPFIIIPILATVLLGYFGLLQLDVEDDFDYLFTPSNSQAKQDVERLQTLGFSPSDLKLQAAARIIVQASDEGNVLREDVLNEVLRLHNIVLNVSNDRGENFTTLCRNSSTEGSCYGNNVVELLITNGTAILANLGYPYHRTEGNSNNTLGQFIGDELGGVHLQSDGATVREAQALQLSYHLATLDNRWIEKFRQAIESFTSENITVTYLTATSLNDELRGMPGRLLPYLGGSAGMVVLYSVLSCMMADCVRSEPWLGLMGSLTSLMAVTSSVGLLLLCGERINTLVMAAIFILIGTGVGNTYTLLWAWRRTDPTLSVRHRMGVAMADAAFAMTVSTLTDCTTFAAGITTQFPAVRAFCVFAAVGAAFLYLYQLMFFAAFMVLSGHREDGNRHCLTCIRVRTASKSPSYNLCCAGDGMPSSLMMKRIPGTRNATKEEIQNPLLLEPSKVSKNASVHSAATFPLYAPPTEHTESENSVRKTTDPFLADVLSSYLGQWLTNPWLKFCIVVVYLAYLGVAIRGCLLVQPGINRYNLAADSSHVIPFSAMETEVFSQYTPRIDLVVTDRGNYSNVNVQDDLKLKLQSFGQSPFFHNTSDILQRSDLDSPRVSVLGKDVSTFLRQRDVMLEARRIATEGDIETLAYAPQFTLYEQLTAVIPNALLMIGIAAAAIFAASFFLVPHWTGAFVVILSGASVLVGVVGYMALWDVRFDVVSTAAILASVALATDFPAHVTYAYVGVSRTSEPTGRLAATMYTAGMPMVQSAVSTILSVILLGVFPAETFRIFFRIILLTMLFSIAHSLLFLPVFLSLMNWCLPTKTHRKEASNLSGVEGVSPDESGVSAPWQEHLEQLDRHISLWEQTEFRSSISDATPAAIGNRMLSTFSSLSTSPTAASLYGREGTEKSPNSRRTPQRSNSMFEGPRTSLDLSLFEARQQARRMTSHDVIIPSARLAGQPIASQERSVMDGPRPYRSYKTGKKEMQDSMRYRLIFTHDDYYGQARRNGGPAVVHARQSSGGSASRPVSTEDASEYSRRLLHKQDSRISVISNPRSVSSIEEELISPRAVVGHPLPGMPKRNSRKASTPQRELSREPSFPRENEHLPHSEFRGRGQRMSMPVVSPLPGHAQQQTDQRRPSEYANAKIRYSGGKNQRNGNRLITPEMKAWIGWVMELNRQDMEVSII